MQNIQMFLDWASERAWIAWMLAALFAEMFGIIGLIYGYPLATLDQRESLVGAVALLSAGLIFFVVGVIIRRLSKTPRLQDTEEEQL